MDAAEAVPQIFRKGFGELVDGQPGGVAGEDGSLAQVRCDLVVQLGFPIHAFGDRLDDQIAIA